MIRPKRAKRLVFGLVPAHGYVVLCTTLSFSQSRLAVVVIGKSAEIVLFKKIV